MKDDRYGIESHTYRLMEKDGFYQWRWDIPYPPEAKGNPAVSPLFSDAATAQKWADEKMTVGYIVCRDASGWKEVKP